MVLVFLVATGTIFYLKNTVNNMNIARAFFFLTILVITIARALYRIHRIARSVSYIQAISSPTRRGSVRFLNLLPLWRF